MTDQTLTWHSPDTTPLPSTGTVLVQFLGGAVRTVEAAELRGGGAAKVTLWAAFALPDAAVQAARQVLAPCPFDGQTDTVQVSEGPGGAAVWVECSECGTRGPRRIRAARAVGDWNRLPR